MQDILKDEKLYHIVNSHYGNVAQFISVDPDDPAIIRLGVINDRSGESFDDLKGTILSLISNSRSKMVNIRSFNKENVKGNKFHYGKTRNDIDEIINIIKENADNNRYSIVNENIDVKDGGVSGVALGNVVEFSPDDTPKCVDKEGVCRLSREMASSLFKTIYGFEPNIIFPRDYRVEFSIHPNREGVHKEHTIIWEYEKCGNYDYSTKITWPNNFSRFLGDKAFGLLVADYLGFKVPYTTVIARRVAPFSFGTRTGLTEKWLRTCPIVKEPGKFTTVDSWTDPFLLIQSDEKKGSAEINIGSLISQDAVNAKYSGGCIVREYADDDVIEGVKGKGDGFMVGNYSYDELPCDVLCKIREINNKIRSHSHIIGDRISIEWVYDGKDVWIVQLNQIQSGATKNRNVIVEGSVRSFIDFETDRGLEALRELITTIKDKKTGIRLIGKVGIASHFGDVLRQAKIPSYIVDDEI